MGSVVLLSLTASLNPTLVAATTMMLLLEKPKRLMGGYLLGAYTASLTCGILIVFALPHSSVTSTTENTVSPWVDIGLGAVALAVAFVFYTGRAQRIAQRRRAKKAAKGPARPPRWQRELSRGSPRVTFVIGMALTLPGASYIAGLTEIHKLGYPTAETVLVIVGFNLIMLWMLEVPLACYYVAPDWTPQAINRAKAWVTRHATTFAIRGFAGIGSLLVLKGLVGIA